jgi:hypothetical protein
MADFGIEYAPGQKFEGMAVVHSFRCTHCGTEFTKAAKNLKASGCPNCLDGLPHDHPKVVPLPLPISNRRRQLNRFLAALQSLTDEQLEQVAAVEPQELQDIIRDLDIEDLQVIARKYLRARIRGELPSAKKGKTKKVPRQKSTTPFIEN